MGKIIYKAVAKNILLCVCLFLQCLRIVEGKFVLSHNFPSDALYYVAPQFWSNKLNIIIIDLSRVPNNFDLSIGSK